MMKKRNWLVLVAGLAILGGLLMSCGENPTEPTVSPPEPTATPQPTATPADADPPVVATLTPTPVSTPVPFQNFEELNGTLNDVFFQDISSSSPAFNTSTFYEGLRALSITAGASGGTVRVFPMSTPINLSTASSLNIWVYDTVGDNHLELTLYDNAGRSQTIVSSSTAVLNTWTQLMWNLVDFNTIDKSNIIHIDLKEGLAGTYYFDGIATP